MNYTDHKTFWLFIAAMIGVPSILFVLALLKATTKDPFSVSGGVESRHATWVNPSRFKDADELPQRHGEQSREKGLTGSSDYRKALDENRPSHSRSSDRPTHTIQLSAVQLTKTLRKI